MGAYASLERTTVRVEPGGETTCAIKVRNSGTIVDQFTFELLGDAAAWAEFEPPSISLLPGTEETATIRFRPPRLPSVVAGPMPIGIRVNSKEDPAGSVVEEGTLDVAQFFQTSAELSPKNRHGRFSTRHKLYFDNLGNAPVEVAFDAYDPDEKLRFDLEPMTALVDPGMRHRTRVKAKALKSSFRGPSQLHPFKAMSDTEGGGTVTVDGTMLQDAIIPKWLIPALLALAILAALWQFALKPTVESVAKDAVQDPITKVNVDNTAQQKALEALQKAIAGMPTSGPSSPPPVKPTKGPAAVVKTPIDGLLASGAQTTFLVPAGRRLSVTDIILQNPNGDSGSLVVQRVAVGGTTRTVLLTVALENFRDLDYHFVTPLVFEPGEALAMVVQCKNTPPEPGKEAAACADAVYFGGFTTKAPAKD